VVNVLKTCYVGLFLHGMAHPRVSDGGDDLQIWRITANIANNQSRTADKGVVLGLGVWRGANNSSL
jgi:hypothetical protein